MSFCAKEKLRLIQSQLKMVHGNFNEEYEEQLMLAQFLNGTEKILEFGGNIGRNSLVAAYILSQKFNKDDIPLVVLEPDVEDARKLKENMLSNGMNFYIENSALSEKQLYKFGWHTYHAESISATRESGIHIPEDQAFKNPVKTITLSELESKYKIKFDTLIIDCENCFYEILVDNPRILDNITKVIVENDWNKIEYYNFFKGHLLRNGLIRIYSKKHPDCYLPCKNNFYEVWEKTPGVI